MTGESQQVPDTGPDPSVLTTEQLDKAIENLKALIESEISATTSVTYEKFSSIQTQLMLVEAQRIEQKMDTKAAVDAALTAQKEAVKEQTTASERAIAKSEASTTKQLEQLIATFNTSIAGVTVAIADVKERVGRIENIKVGGRETVAGIYALGAFILTVLIIGGIVLGINTSKG